jgi:hypothetical protein
MTGQVPSEPTSFSLRLMSADAAQFPRDRPLQKQIEGDWYWMTHLGIDPENQRPAVCVLASGLIPKESRFE